MIELLVVIAIITILAGILLPGLGRAKERSKLTRCLNNLKQAGLGFAMYCHDNSDRFPLHPQNCAGFQYGGGDPNWSLLAGYPNLVAATNRPLWSSVPAPEVFHCPADRGMDVGDPIVYGNVFRTIGTSYVYNFTSWARTKTMAADPDDGLAGKPYHWVLEPARHILLFEPPALPFENGVGDWYFLWHFNSGPGTLHSPNDIHQKVISPILFVDSHVAIHDFTTTVKSNWPAEPTANWVWYRAAP